MLKILGTLESTLDAAHWHTLLKRDGWQVSTQNERVIAQKAASRLEVEGQGFTLIFGTISNQVHELEQIHNLLLEAGQLLQMDVFEEDGRMIKRIHG